jgi:hypothetical protein
MAQCRLACRQPRPQGRIPVLRDTHRNLIVKDLGYSAGNGHRVLECLYEHPIVSVNDVRDLTGTSHPCRQSIG